MTVSRDTKRYIRLKKDFPDRDHWAIILFSQRSETDPYDSGRSERVDQIDYIAYDTEEEWKNHIHELTISTIPYGSRNEFVAFKSSKPAIIKTQIIVDIK